MTRVLLTLLVGLVVSMGAVVSSGPVLSSILPNVSPEEQYRFSLGRALQNDLETAADGFREIKNNPSHPRRLDATFWLARVQHMRGKFVNAADTFAEFNRAAPDNDSRLLTSTWLLTDAVSQFAPVVQACAVYLKLPKIRRFYADKRVRVRADDTKTFAEKIDRLIANNSCNEIATDKLSLNLLIALNPPINDGQTVNAWLE
jgi:hypothetical protein